MATMQSINTVRGQKNEVHAPLGQQQEHQQQHFASKDVLEARIKGTQHYSQTSVSVLASPIPQHVETHLRSHKSLVHDIVKPLFDEQHKPFDSCINEMRRMCHNGMDSKVYEMNSFVATRIHDACEQTKSIAPEVGGVRHTGYVYLTQLVIEVGQRWRPKGTAFRGYRRMQNKFQLT